MATSLDAFKRLLMQVPKLDTTDNFKAEQVYDYYLTRERVSDVESFYREKFDCLASRAAPRQDKYNELYSKFKEISFNLTETFRISHPH